MVVTNGEGTPPPAPPLTSTWQEIVQKKRAIRDAALQPYLSTTTTTTKPDDHEDESSITEISDIDVLAAKMASGELSAREVIEAYTNCLTEILFPSALARATELDAYYSTHGRTIGPLHGVPVTLKDQFDVRGVDSTIGYVGRAFQPARADAVVVQILKRLGAVILAKTNLPQSIMWCETENPLWGLTTNPRDATFTPGGSTGGEGAVLALHGSILGWGTDIGGSIRIPSLINGLYGFKPSSARFPYYGIPVSTEGQEHVSSAIGPMARSLSTITSVTQALLSAAPWELDPRVVPLPWRPALYSEMAARPLVVGILWDDGIVKPHPPITRHLQRAVERIVAAGHEVVEWDAALHRECVDIMDRFYTVDGGEDIRRAVQQAGEPFIPHVEALVNRGPAVSVYEYWQLNKLKVDVQKRYLDKWNSIKAPRSGRAVDVLLMPTMPHVAVPHKSCRWVGYTKVWNVLDYTALALPVGQVSATEDTIVSSSSNQPYEPRNELDAWNWNLYNPDTMSGHPVGLQIVGRRFDEERVLGAAKVLESLL
ncbi:amidase [Phlyctema vagabunda]|uniref:Amidase n=1 Tax=Phlyctema vagabunda TaxID=108571 RepID=A0ABR4PS39_9HELO